MAVKAEHSYSISGSGAVSSSNSNVSNVACTSSSSSAAATAAINNLYFANGCSVRSNGNGAGSDGDSEPASPVSLEDGKQMDSFVSPRFEQTTQTFATNIHS